MSAFEKLAEHQRRAGWLFSCLILAATCHLIELLKNRVCPFHADQHDGYGENSERVIPSPKFQVNGSPIAGRPYGTFITVCCYAHEPESSTSKRGSACAKANEHFLSSQIYIATSTDTITCVFFLLCLPLVPCSRLQWRDISTLRFAGCGSR